MPTDDVVAGTGPATAVGSTGGRRGGARNFRGRAVGLGVVGLLLIAAAALAVRTHFRYQKADTMAVAVREFTNAEYPEDPANRSLHHGQYNGRRLRLEKKD